MVTEQALQGVRLRSVKKQENPLPDVLQANISALHLLNTSLTERSRNRVNMAETSVGKDGTHVSVDQPKQNLDSGLEKQTKCHELKPHTFKCDVIRLNSLGVVEESKLMANLNENKNKQIETDTSKTCIALANVPCCGPSSKIPSGTDEINCSLKKIFLPQELTDNLSQKNKLSDQAVSPGNNEKPWQIDSMSWIPNGIKSKQHRAFENDEKSSEHHEPKGYSDPKQGKMVTKPISPKKIPSCEKPGSIRKVCSPEKPSLPKKPDLGFLRLTSTTTSRKVPGVQRNTGQMAKCLSDPCFFQTDETGLADESYSPKNLNPDSLPVNTSAAADVTPPLSASSPKKQKPPIFHKKPEVTFLTTGTPMNFTTMDTPQSIEAVGVVRTMDKCCSNCPLSPKGTSRHNHLNVITGTQNLNSITDIQSSAGNQTSSKKPDNIGNPANSSVQSIVRLQPHWDDGSTKLKRPITASLLKAQEMNEEHICESTRTQILMMPSATKKKESKRKKRSCSQLLMMPQTVESTLSSSSYSSSSSSSSSSSEDEEDEVKARLTKMRAAISLARYEDTSDSESSGAPQSQSKYSLSSALSSDSLQVELSLTDLQIQEGEEDVSLEVAQERNQEVQQEGKSTFHFKKILFVSRKKYQT